MRHRVQQATTVAACLAQLFPDSSGRTRKQMLEAGRVRVAGHPVAKGKTPLAAGSEVTIDEGPRRARLPPGLSMVLEDDQFLVVEKDAGLLTVATDKERRETAYAHLREYVKSSDPGNKIFIVHRLDREASGLLVFARSGEAKTLLQDQFRSHGVERIYRAVVEGRIEQDSGRIEQRLHEDPVSGIVRPARTGGPGLDAVTRFEVVARGARDTVLDLRLETGRKHQIRVHLAGLGHPIVGDRAYGATSNPARRLALHARLLGFDHPRTGKRLRFESKIPARLARLGR